MFAFIAMKAIYLNNQINNLNRGQGDSCLAMIYTSDKGTHPNVLLTKIDGIVNGSVKYKC